MRVKQSLYVTPVLSSLAPAYLLPSKRPNIYCLTFQDRASSPVLIPPPCCARTYPNKAGAHRPARFMILHPHQTSLPDDLGKLISWDDRLMTKLGWEDF